MDVVRRDVVRGEVADRLDRVRFTSELDLVALHRFLDRGTDITYANVDSGGLTYNCIRIRRSWFILSST